MRTFSSRRAVSFALAAAVFVATVVAECPNACSGHGDCSTSHDYCTCYDGFMGADCNDRICQFGVAFVDAPTGDFDFDNMLESGGYSKYAATFPTGVTTSTSLNPQIRKQGFWERHPAQLYGSADQTALPWRVRADEGHFYAECSARGNCDRRTGMCACFPGHEGSACQRTACPHSCSGHGICRPIAERSEVDVTYNLWDAAKISTCVCDSGYGGVDCAQRICPRGDDPMTTTTTRKEYNDGLSERAEVQLIDVRCPGGGTILDPSIALVFSDKVYGDNYTTSWFDFTDTSSTNEAAVLALLKGLPNQVLADFAVDGTTIIGKIASVDIVELETDQHYQLRVTFSSSYGDVPQLGVKTNFQCKGGVAVNTRAGDTDVFENIRVSVLGDGPTEYLKFVIDVDSTGTDVFSYVVQDKNGDVFSGASAEAHTPTNTAVGTPETLSNAGSFTREATKVQFHWEMGDGTGSLTRGSASDIQYVVEILVDPVVTVRTDTFDLTGAAIANTDPRNAADSGAGTGSTLTWAAPSNTSPLYDTAIVLERVASNVYSFKINGDFIAYVRGTIPGSGGTAVDLNSLIPTGFDERLPANGQDFYGSVKGSAASFTPVSNELYKAYLPKTAQVVSAVQSDTINVAFLNDRAPTASVQLVLKIVSVSTSQDTYAWKLAGDPTWMDNSGAGYNIPASSTSAVLHGLSAYLAAWPGDDRRAQVQYVMLQWSNGADFDQRICSTASGGSLYYVHVGSDGLNDYPVCSDRGLCDSTGGQCMCFSGYSGLACSEQNALSRGAFSSTAVGAGGGVSSGGAAGANAASK